MALGPPSGEQRPVDVGDKRRGKRAKRRVDRREHDGAQHEPAEHGRHRLTDEKGQDLVGPSEGRSGVLGVEGVKTRAEPQVDDEGQQRADRGQRQGALALPPGLDRQEPLHQVVVGPERGHRPDEAVQERDPHDVRVAEDPAPEIARARRRSPVDEVEAPGSARDLNDGAEAPVDLGDQKSEGDRARAEEHHRLEHVRPHDRLHPSGRDVDDRDDHEDRDRRQQRPAQEVRHRHRRHREPDARAGQTGDEEEDRRRHLAGLPEAVQ